MYKLGNKRFSYKLVLFAVDVLSSVKAVFIFLIMAVLLCNLEFPLYGWEQTEPHGARCRSRDPLEQAPLGAAVLVFSGLCCGHSGMFSRGSSVRAPYVE